MACPKLEPVSMMRTMPMMRAVTTARNGMRRPVRRFALVVSCCANERLSAA
jgi:hypothetical protein